MGLEPITERLKAVCSTNRAPDLYLISANIMKRTMNSKDTFAAEHINMLTISAITSSFFTFFIIATLVFCRELG